MEVHGADDLADFWRAHKAASQEKRARNRETAPKRLEAAGIEFRSHNHGVHLLVLHAGRVVDFWPGTGLWQDRVTTRKGRGVQNLIDWLKKSRN